jgi:hypothetical protein
MTKNVIVVDEFGIDYGTTYQKRAKGLVKSGRARFTEDNRICLTRPPEKFEGLFENSPTTSNSEDKLVENTNNIKANPAATDGENFKITTAEILARIDKIIEDKTHINDAFAALKGSGAAQQSATGMAIGTIVEEREKTNQRMLDLLEKLYDNNSDKNLTPDAQELNALGNVLNSLKIGINLDSVAAIFVKAAEEMFKQPQPSHAETYSNNTSIQNYDDDDTVNHVPSVPTAHPTGVTPPAPPIPKVNAKPAN